MGFMNFLKTVGLGAGAFGLIGAVIGAGIYMCDGDGIYEDGDKDPLYGSRSRRSPCRRSFRRDEGRKTDWGDVVRKPEHFCFGLSGSRQPLGRRDVQE